MILLISQRCVEHCEAYESHPSCNDLCSFIDHLESHQHIRMDHLAAIAQRNKDTLFYALSDATQRILSEKV